MFNLDFRLFNLIYNQCKSLGSIFYLGAMEGADYISISFLDLNSGDNFQVISEDIEYIKLNVMTKYNIKLNLSSSKFGLKLDIEEVEEELGSIIHLSEVLLNKYLFYYRGGYMVN